MEKPIPLHSLVFFCDSLQEAEKIFSLHEIVNLTKIMIELVGSYRFDLIPIVVDEMRRRTSLKMSLGERVVLTELPKEYMQQFADVALNQGAPIFTVSRSEWIIGHRIILDIDTIIPVAPLPEKPLSYLNKKWNGITIVGDVHGNLRPLQDALAWARSRHHFVWLLGDVIDYGSETLQTIETAYEMVMKGEGAFILGNHERKIAKWLSAQDSRIKMSEGNQITVDAYQRLSSKEKNQWLGKFRSLLGRSSLVVNLGNVTMTHAATHPDLWTPHGADDAAIENYALYGESDSRETVFTRSYRWVDSIPAGKTVFVGHDIRSNTPLNVMGSKGGRAIFLDTGCGKGGKLSSCDLRFNNVGLRIENFNVH